MNDYKKVFLIKQTKASIGSSPYRKNLSASYWSIVNTPKNLTPDVIFELKKYIISALAWRKRDRL